MTEWIIPVGLIIFIMLWNLWIERKDMAGYTEFMEGPKTLKRFKDTIIKHAFDYG